jgi:AcrR family transcriptional regulator
MTSTSRTGRRRRPAGERRAETVRAASVIAVSEGLDKLTAKRVVQAVGVVPGLVVHHFKSADELIAAVFSHAATAATPRSSSTRNAWTIQWTGYGS